MSLDALRNMLPEYAKDLKLNLGSLAAETLLIMDEPLASLDSERKAELLGYFERIPEITGIPVLYITHAADEAERLAKTVLTMKDGRIADIRTPA